MAQTHPPIARAMARVNDTLRRASILLLGDDGHPAPLARTATGISALDDALGGGFARGRVVELFGPPSGGKTTLALAIVAGVQRGGGCAAFIDAEGSLEPQRALDAGVDLRRLIAARPAVGEEALQMVDALLKARAVDVVVIDSVAALVPRAELLAPLGESPAGLHARLMSQSLRRIVVGAADAKATVLFLNQTRTTFDDDGRAIPTTPGGAALHFFAATRLEVRAAAGQRIVRIVKDRFGAEGRVAILPPPSSTAAAATALDTRGPNSSRDVVAG